MSSTCSFTSIVPSLPKITAAKRITGGAYRGRVMLKRSSLITRANSGRLTITGSVSGGSRMQFQPLIKSTRAITHGANRTQSVCANAVNATCGEAQTETVTRKPDVISPFMGKEKLPQLDDGGSGYNGGGDVPPYYRGGDGGGGGGGGFAMGGAFSWGAFWFFFFLEFLKYFFMKNKESEARYISITGRRKTIRHFLE